MLTRIDVDSEIPFYFPILGAAPKDSLMARSVTGLNPPDKDLFIGDYARDGGSYQGRRVGSRNVVIILDINPNPALGETVSGWREKLYKAFNDPQPDGDFLEIILKDDVMPDRYLVGYCDKYDGDIFSSDTQASVSFMCPDPYIRDVTPTLKSSDLGWVSMSFPYGGSAETGFEAEIYLSSPTSQLVLAVNGKTMVMTYAFTAGNVVYINTNRGSRNILMASTADVAARSAMDVTTRWTDLDDNDLTTPLIASLSTASPWIELHSSSNVMSVYGTTPMDGVASIRTLSYRQSYWGV